MYYNPVRWICQFQNHRDAVCDGKFRPSGYAGARGDRCRLYDRCHGSPHQLEYGYHQYRSQKQLTPPRDPVKSRAHDVEQIALKRCFDPGCRNGETARRYKEKPWAFKKEPIHEMVPGYVPLTRKTEIPPPPCGGDCENCPYDDGCRYPGWDEEHADQYVSPHGLKYSRQAHRQANKKYDDKTRERRKVDPEFDAMMREKTRAYAKKAREKRKWIKLGRSPAAFEIAWSKGEVVFTDLRCKNQKEGGN